MAVDHSIVRDGPIRSWPKLVANCPRPLLAELDRLAAENDRSRSSQARVLLSRAVAEEQGEGSVAA